jgi:hypothetical protein
LEKGNIAMSEKKVVKLRIQVPANVEVVTEVVGSDKALAVEGGSKSKDLVLDLTTKRTAQWLSKSDDVVGQEGGGDPNFDASCNCACCVRG